MIDISHKTSTLRYAVAEGRINTTDAVIKIVKENKVPKGNLFEVARAAGIQAAKKTPEWLVFCHSMPIEWADLSFETEGTTIIVRAEVRTVWKTGVEMEAMTAAGAALLNIYDMLKPLDKDLEIQTIRLVKKEGGKSDYSDTFDRPVKVSLIRISNKVVAGGDDNATRTVQGFLAVHDIDIVDNVTIGEDEHDIKESLCRMADNGRSDILFSVGGTGLDREDRVPDITRDISESEIDGIGESMRGYGRDRTPYAMFSRSTAGVRSGTLIINLPGSSRGAEESLQALFPGLFHALLMINRGKLRGLKP